MDVTLKQTWPIFIIICLCIKYESNSLIFWNVMEQKPFRASVKRTYDVYYALRLPPDVQIELQRRTADFRKEFPYQKFAACVDWALSTSHFPLAGVLLTAVSSVAAPFWWLRDHCVYLSRVLSWLIDVCIIKLSTATPENIRWNYMKSLLFFNIYDILNYYFVKNVCRLKTPQHFRELPNEIL